MDCVYTTQLSLEGQGVTERNNFALYIFTLTILSQFPQYSQSVLAFTTETLNRQTNTTKAFLRAWNKAVADINQNPNAYRDVLIEKTNVPPMIQGTYEVPKYPAAEITTEAEWNDVLAWMQDKGLVDQPVSYEESVDKSFLE